MGDFRSTCPKCGNGMAIRYQASFDQMECVCGRCGYRDYKAPLDRKPSQPAPKWELADNAFCPGCADMTCHAH